MDRPVLGRGITVCKTGALVSVTRFALSTLNRRNWERAEEGLGATYERRFSFKLNNLSTYFLSYAKFSLVDFQDSTVQLVTKDHSSICSLDVVYR